MKKEFTLYGSFVTLVLLLSTVTSYLVGRGSIQIDLASLGLFLLWSITITAIYFYLHWKHKRFQGLVEKSEMIASNPSIGKIDITGNDELAIIAKSFSKLQDEVIVGEKLRNRMVADVAHELRTPLSILKGQLESIVEGVSELKQENLLPLLDETTRMSKLIQDLRQLSLAESGNLQLDQKWVDLQGMINEIISILTMEAVEKEVTIKLIGALSQEVYCDQLRIKQVLINLIGNGIRYTPENGELEIHLSELDHAVFIEIHDNGPGIPPEHLPYIFQRFYRVEESRNRSFGGMGLGLAIANEFIKAHGGEIKVNSELGQGTTFSIKLPIFPES